MAFRYVIFGMQWSMQENDCNKLCRILLHFTSCNVHGMHYAKYTNRAPSQPIDQGETMCRMVDSSGEEKYTEYVKRPAA